MGEKGNDLAIVYPSIELPILHDNSNLRRCDFPEGFIFGTGTSAYQVEGAAAIDGKGPSLWDDFTLRTPGRIAGGSNGNVAADMYNRYKEDIRTMKAMGFDAYRFSISWPRILPGGRCSAGINRKGIDYYNDVIDTVITHGMQPYVTLFHWDLPDCLEKEYDGFLSKNIVRDFCEFAELCFWEFGDRVKWWTTINEPWTYAVNGYVKGLFPPSKASCPAHRILKNLPAHRSDQPDASVPTTRSYSDVKYDKSDPAKDAYTVARNLLLAHAAAVQLYRTKFKEFQKGQIGIVLNSHWFVPLNENSPDDAAASRRAVDFMLGWFLNPVLYGCYPKSMIDFVPPENLAPFTHCESERLKGSTDYVGLNYYTTNYASNDPCHEGVGYDADQKLKFHTDRNGTPIGAKASGSSWLFIVPWGIYELLVYLKNAYPNIPPIYITENGVSDENKIEYTAKQACVDTTRTKYHQDHLANILRAINYFPEVLDVRGYFVWSWCDNFEWAAGYQSRFGITYIDYINNQTRYPKESAMWFAKFLKGTRKLFKNNNPLSKKRQTEEDSENVPEKRSRALEE